MRQAEGVDFGVSFTFLNFASFSRPHHSLLLSFSGTAGQAIISKTAAYLITDSRYWIQAANQVDSNWSCLQAGHVDGPKDWIEWLVDRTKDSRIGIDARMLSHTKATELTNQLSPKGSKLVFPPQNLIDLVWKDKPLRSKEPVFVHPMEFTGSSTPEKLVEVRTWIRSVPPTTSSYSKSVPTPDKYHVATLITALDAIGKWVCIISALGKQKLTVR